MMLCCLHDGFNGTVGLSLSQVFLESISEDGQLAIGLEATEGFLGLQQAGGGPSERHLGVSPAFDVAGDLAHRAERVLDDVGAGERAPEFVRQAEADDGEDLVQPLQDAARDARFLMLQTPGQVAQEPLGLVCVVLVPGLTERLLDARVQMLGQALDDVTALVDLAALDGGGHTEGVSDRFAECLRAIDDEQPRQRRIFEDRYGRPGKGNDKGNVEGVVGYDRRNFMTPLPRFASWDAFNGHLEEQCRNRQGNVLRGHRESIGERFVRDREALKRPLPAPFDACDKQGTRVNSLSLVRYRTNDYSVPVAYGHQEVWIRGYVHEVVIGCGAGIIARHPRSYDREDMVFDPIHYLPLLEHKIGALDQAAPLAGWELPDAFPTLRRLLEARMGKAGKREYVQVLRLLETFDLEVLHGAVKDALRLGAIGYDAVKHLVLCRIERRPPKLDLDIYPYLPRANVATTAAASYMSLLGGGAS